MAAIRPARIIIFDNDGTLMPSHEVANPAIQIAFARFCAEKGIDEPAPSDERICMLTGQPGDAFYRALLPDPWKDLAPELRARSLDEEVAAIHRQGRLYPGIEELLRELRRRGARLAVASHGGERYIGAVAERLHYPDHFDRIYYHGFEGMQSKTEMAARALRELGPGPGLFVGDRRADGEAARSAGIPFIGCAYGYGTPEELAGAEAVAATPADLRSILLDGRPPDGPPAS